ncbi:MAG: response regulator transcription factor [Acidobacteriota bacterium]
MSTDTRLLLAGGTAVFRECLVSLLADEKRYREVDQVADLAAARQRIEDEACPDLLLADLGQAQDETFDELVLLTQDHPTLTVLAIGLPESEDFILRCVDAGTHGWVLKDASFAELIKAIDMALRGETFCSPYVANIMFGQLADLVREQRRKERLEALTLTPREMEVLELIADGLSNKEIAARLYLSPFTIKNHVHRVLEKLEATDRAEAVRKAQLKRWLRPRLRRTALRI